VCRAQGCPATATQSRLSLQSAVCKHLAHWQHLGNHHDHLGQPPRQPVDEMPRPRATHWSSARPTWSWKVQNRCQCVARLYGGAPRARRACRKTRVVGGHFVLLRSIRHLLPPGTPGRRLVRVATLSCSVLATSVAWDRQHCCRPDIKGVGEPRRAGAGCRLCPAIL
jgi:hypothetical protein